MNICSKDDEHKSSDIPDAMDTQPSISTANTDETASTVAPNLPADNSVPEDEICRKYIWGICYKHPTQCRFKHVRNVELMLKLLKFCHDFQNKGCVRPNCSYLHTSREEINKFKYFKQIPQVLIDRYDALDARILNNGSGISAGNGGAFVPPPPPPPAVGEVAGAPAPPTPAIMSFQMPPPPPPSTTVPQSNVNVVQLPIRQQAMAPLNPTPQFQMPPPLPSSTTLPQSNVNVVQLPVRQQAMAPLNPTPPATNTSHYLSSPVQQPLHTSGVTMSKSYGLQRVPLNSVQPTSILPPTFDASRPPPCFSVRPATKSSVPEVNAPLTATQSHESLYEPIAGPSVSIDDSHFLHPFKRPRVSNDPFSPGPSIEAASVASDDELCDDCIQRVVRISEMNNQIAKLTYAEAENELLYQDRLENYRRTKRVVLSLVRPEDRVLLEDYLDTNDASLLRHLSSFPRRTASSQDSDTALIMQQIFSQCSQILSQNQMQNLVVPAMPGPSGVLPRSHGFDQSTSSQTRASSTQMPNVTMQTNTARSEEIAYPEFNPNVPPPNISHIHPSPSMTYFRPHNEP